MHISADKVHNPGLEGPTNGVFAAILDKVEKNTTIEKVADKVADKVAESGMLPADNNLDMKDFVNRIGEPLTAEQVKANLERRRRR